VEQLFEQLATSGSRKMLKLILAEYAKKLTAVITDDLQIVDLPVPIFQVIDEPWKAQSEVLEDWCVNEHAWFSAIVRAIIEDANANPVTVSKVMLSKADVHKIIDSASIVGMDPKHLITVTIRTACNAAISQYGGARGFSRDERGAFASQVTAIVTKAGDEFAGTLLAVFENASKSKRITFD
jgi:hypothetical protein